MNPPKADELDYIHFLIVSLGADILTGDEDFFSRARAMSAADSPAFHRCQTSSLRAAVHHVGLIPATPIPPILNNTQNPIPCCIDRLRPQGLAQKTNSAFYLQKRG